ncbi:DsbE family thiol:disulfide interchange protein [Dongia sp.]|uniref:DsbE family thiol:disulfide interchange protein n=1 Tax=Dongia sp. TaxID=1977262 RepID=UPI0035AD9D60
MRRLFYILPVLVLGALLALFWRGLDPARDPAALPSAMIGKPAAAIELQGLGSRTGVATKDFKGEITLLNFFASWCAPCRAEHPLIKELAALPGVRVIGIAFKDRPADSEKYLAELGDPYRAIGVDADGRAGMEFGLTGVPETYVIDRDGIIRYRLAQPLDPSRLEGELKPLLKELTR